MFRFWWSIFQLNHPSNPIGLVGSSFGLHCGSDRKINTYEIASCKKIFPRLLWPQIGASQSKMFLGIYKFLKFVFTTILEQFYFHPQVIPLHHLQRHMNHYYFSRQIVKGWWWTHDSFFVYQQRKTRRLLIQYILCMKHVMYQWYVITSPCHGFSNYIVLSLFCWSRKRLNNLSKVTQLGVTSLQSYFSIILHFRILISGSPQSTDICSLIHSTTI